MLSPECELSHPLDRRRLREVGEMLFDHSAYSSRDPRHARRLANLDLEELRDRIEGDILNLLLCTGDGSKAGTLRAHEVTLRLLERADHREGAGALADMAKDEVLVAAEGA